MCIKSRLLSGFGKLVKWFFSAKVNAHKYSPTGNSLSFSPGSKTFLATKNPHTSKAFPRSGLPRASPWRLIMLPARDLARVTEHCPRATSSPNAQAGPHYVKRWAQQWTLLHYLPFHRSYFAAFWTCLFVVIICLLTGYRCLMTLGCRSPPGLRILLLSAPRRPSMKSTYTDVRMSVLR